MSRIALLLTLLCAAPLSAQTPDDPSPTNFAVAAAGNAWNSVANYLQKAAEQFPDSAYGFKPTPEVRSFGELIGHVAGSQQMFCAAALGEPQPEEDAVEKSAKSRPTSSMRSRNPPSTACAHTPRPIPRCKGR